ncbi:PDZ domain-containing protein [Streptomyces tricolor]|nr:PDZ domain-containing protein [Streptomyces tricolor]
MRRDGRWTVKRILPGDSSDSKARSPLAGTGIRDGAVLTHVDGRPVDPVTGPYPLPGRLGRYDGGADVPPGGGRHRARPAGRRRAAHRRTAAALPGLGGQTAGGGPRVERRQVRLPAHPGHGRLRLGPVQPRPAHGGVPAGADRGRARQRGRGTSANSSSRS